MLVTVLTLVFTFLFLPSTQAEQSIYCNGVGEIRMNGSILHVYSYDYPRSLLLGSHLACELTVLSHFNYLDVIFVEGAFLNQVKLTSLSKHGDVRIISNPVISMDDIEHFVGASGVLFSASVPADGDYNPYTNPTFANFWNAFHFIFRGYGKLKCCIDGLACADYVPNCQTPEEGTIELSLYHGHVFTVNLWEVGEVVNCDWKFSTLTSNLSVRLDVLLSTRGEEEPDNFRFVLFHGEEVLHNLTSQNELKRFYIEDHDLHSKQLHFVYNAWNWFECLIYLRFIVYEAPKNFQRGCDYELLDAGGENLTVAMGPQVRIPLAPISGDLESTYLPNQDCRWELLVPSGQQIYVMLFGAYTAYDEKFPNDGDSFELWTDGTLRENKYLYYTASKNLTIIFSTDRAEGSGGASFVFEIMDCDCYAKSPAMANVIPNATESFVMPGNGDIFTTDKDIFTICRPLECRWTRIGGSVYFEGDWYFYITGRLELYENGVLLQNFSEPWVDTYTGRVVNMTLVMVSYVSDLQWPFRRYAGFLGSARISDISNFIPNRIEDAVFNDTFLIAASAWQPGTAYRRIGTLRTSIFVHYLKVNAADSHTVDVYDGSDFATLDEFNQIFQVVRTPLSGEVWDPVAGSWLETQAEMDDFKGLKIARNPNSAPSFNGLFIIESLDIDQDLAIPVGYGVRYVDTFVRFKLPRNGSVPLPSCCSYRFAARSPTNRPRLGLFSPNSDDLCIGGEILLTIKPFGCDDIPPLTLNRADLERRTFFPLPWHAIIFSYKASTDLTFIITSEHDTGVHDAFNHEWTTSCYTKALIQAGIELSFNPFATERACSVTFRHLVLSTNASVQLTFNEFFIPLTNSMAGVTWPFPKGGQFGLLVHSLTVADEFHVVLDAPDLDCHFNCSSATTTTQASHAQNIESYLIIGGVWFAIFLLFIIMVIIILMVLFRNPYNLPA